MPEIEHKKREPQLAKEEDVIIKTGRFRIYFQNYYTIISLVNDILTGGLYFAGSISNLLGAPAIIGNITYLAGGFFLLMRPMLRIIRNVFIYNEEEYQREVVDVEVQDEEEYEEVDDDYPKSKTTKKAKAHALTQFSKLVCPRKLD